MTLLQSLTGQIKNRTARETSGGSTACAHDQRDPRWNSMADVGRTDLIDHYVCRRCGRKLAAESGARAQPP